MKKEIAYNLLNKGAVRLSPRDPFSWTSGIKSPIYCDNRLMIGFVEERAAVVQAFVKMINDQGVKPDVVGGTATAAIPWAAFVADALNLPMIYIRPQKKMHGTTRQIEGFLKPDSKVLIVEDLVSTGGSSIEAARVVREEGQCQVEDIFAIMSYGIEGTAERIEAQGLNLSTLTDFDTLLEVAVEKEFIKEDEQEVLKDFMKDPKGWYGRNF